MSGNKGPTGGRFTQDVMRRVRQTSSSSGEKTFTADISIVANSLETLRMAMQTIQSILPNHKTNPDFLNDLIRSLHEANDDPSSPKKPLTLSFRDTNREEITGLLFDLDGRYIGKPYGQPMYLKVSAFQADRSPLHAVVHCQPKCRMN